MEPQSTTTLGMGNVGRYRMDAQIQFEGLASDSRQVKPGYLFAALPGAAYNGADFIADAVRRGATVVLGLPELARQARELGVAFLADENPRLRLAHLASAFYGGQPSVVAAVTGTNGKTSVAVFLRQIWAYCGYKAASLGTIGLVTSQGTADLKHTTPDPVELHRRLSELKYTGVDHLALEASSHGLDQYRLDGVRIAAAAFTNITRDHLDYHSTFEDYLSAKLRLFTDLVLDGGVAVVNVDAVHSDAFAAAARDRHLDLLTVGQRGETIKLLSQQPHMDGQNLSVTFRGERREIFLPLAGGFQASNALVAAGMALGLGAPAEQVFSSVANLGGAPGRLEKVAYAPSGAPVYVDYAHTPDALATVLTALRPHASKRLQVVFGCGGDRDRGKRPLMGAVACKYADIVIVTDDNPRGEDAALIRDEVLAGCPAARNIGNRADAIRAGIEGLAAGDILVIAGKGHESGQIIGTEIRPFSDREEAIHAAVSLGGRPAEDMR